MRLILLWLVLLVGCPVIAQKKFTISGYIEDAKSGEKLIAANVLDLKSGQGTITNTYGFFSLTLPSDSVVLNLSYVGYATRQSAFFLDKDVQLNLSIEPEIQLQEIEIVATKVERIQEKVQMSQATIPIEQIKRIPALLGEVDVLKVLQLLPGVQSGGEGQNGLYVRGGSPDQNLILLDGVPVYNVSHLLGFFSVFNADAIKNVTLTKGGFPARYGGRLSSVIDISMKEGNMKEFHGEGSIGLITTKLTFEGPIIKDKTSFLISARRTYIDALAAPLIKASLRAEGSEGSVKLNFYDLNVKINHKINDKHRLYLSSYSGRDVFGVKIKDNYDNGNYDILDNDLGWGNLTTAFRWNWQINPKLFANTTLTYTQFKFNLSGGFESKYNNKIESTRARYQSGINDIGAKFDLDFIPSPRHYVRAGISYVNHTYNPGALVVKANFEDLTIDTLLGSQKAFSNEVTAYVEDEWQLGSLKANVGLHFAGFFVNQGGNTFYPSVQPRVGLNYLLNKNWSLKASFATMTQFINLLTNEALSLPTDLWVPSTKKIKPQESWQAAIGTATTLWNDYEFSVEAYYKKMTNVLSYKEGASFLSTQGTDWQDKVTQGNGTAYGSEFFLQKKTGKTTGWIGYTLSWNFRQFDDINGGRQFPFKYDRRHDASLVINHQFTKKFAVNMAWVYGTGNAISLPEYVYSTFLPYGYFNNSSDVEVETGTDKNNFRMPAYHRLDVGLEWYKKKKRYERWWIISVYNAYNRANPYFIYRDTDFDTQKTVFRGVSLFRMIPSFAWRFKF